MRPLRPVFDRPLPAEVGLEEPRLPGCKLHLRERHFADV